MSPFTQKVILMIQKIPHGKVVSYGQVAAYIGVPRASRQVGWILHSTEGKVDLPWWRVVNNNGYLSIRGNDTYSKSLQKKLLQSEGVEVDGQFHLSMKEFRYRATAEELKLFELPYHYLHSVISKYV